MIRLADFRPVALGDKLLFESFYSKFPQSHSEYLFSSLVSWAHYTPVSFLLKDDDLILMHLKDGAPQFRPPIGERSAQVLRQVFDLAKADGGSPPVVAIDSKTKDWILSLFPNIKLSADRDFFDYVYLAKTLSELPGKPYLTLRNHLNSFRRKYEYSVEPISSGNMEDARTFLTRWCLWRDCSSSPMLEAERVAVLYCMEHFSELGLSGIVLRIGNEIQALSVYEALNSETAVIVFEKAMPEFDGIYPAIGNEAARILAKDFKFINRESDLGIAGLRTAKQRLHPDHMEELYYIAEDCLQLSFR
jgi:hypothetical protein